MQKGNIGVTTENIFPVIKKFLYSDHEIFLREMVSNAVDASQKMKTLAEKGDFKGELGDLTVRVSLDEKEGTLTISDRGIGMTEEEIDKYINQIAFSGVNDFLEKYKDNANNIIGHFGLGFYSSFMVSKKVDIITKSYKDGAKAVKWSCDGSPAYEIDDAERESRGTDIVLHIDDDCKEFLEKSTIQGLLNKYCKFMPVPVAFGTKTEWKDGKDVETDEDNIINNVEPLWTKTPSTLKDEDYKSFYRTLYPMQDEPLFWIHLNVDYPFNLTGILYFPRIKSNIELQRNKIQLYCNQVFVTDQVEGIVPDFLTLLHGVIDSPDIPLNVSRSYLQSDRDVKKIATYITKKVSDRLQSIFKEDRKGFEEKWDDLKIFINYGMLSEESFYDRAKDFAFYDSNKKPLTVNGFCDMQELSNMTVDLKVRGENILIINAKENRRSEAYGKAYVNFFSSIQGPVDHLAVRAKLDVLPSTNLYYILRDSPITTDNRLKELVKFTDFTQPQAQPTVLPTVDGIDVNLNISVMSGSHITCWMNTNHTNYLDITGSGDLRMRYAADKLSMTGRYTIAQGEMKYSLPVIPLKTFTISEDSYIEFTGDIMNPRLNITATEKNRATVTEDGQSRTVEFTCGVAISKTLQDMGLDAVFVRAAFFGKPEALPTPDLFQPLYQCRHIAGFQHQVPNP